MASNRDSFNEINITPLTDIFLVLLIIMMVIAPLLDQQGLNLVVPDNVEVKELPEKNEFLTITVSNDNEYIFEDEVIDPNQLAAFIKESSKDYPNGLVIQTEAEAVHGTVVKLMDIARNSGIVNITISEI